MNYTQISAGHKDWHVMRYLPAKVFDVALARADLQRLFFGSLEVFFLTNVGHESDDFIAFILIAFQRMHMILRRLSLV